MYGCLSKGTKNLNDERHGFRNLLLKISGYMR